MTERERELEEALNRAREQIAVLEKEMGRLKEGYEMLRKNYYELQQAKSTLKPQTTAAPRKRFDDDDHANFS